MASIPKKVLFAAIPTGILLLGTELAATTALRQQDTAADLVSTAALGDHAWVHRRDQHLGEPWEPDPQRSGWTRPRAPYLARGLNLETFPTDDAGELRLFALGGSTTQGAPFEAREHGFPARTQRLLEERVPEVPVRIINAGIAGADSRAFLDIAEAALDLGADGFLIYAGNNEIPGTLTEHCTNPWAQELLQWGDRSAALRLGRRWWRAQQGDGLQRLQTDGATLSGCMRETDRQARSLPSSPQPNQPRSDGLHTLAVDTFRSNLASVIDLARTHGVPVWLAIPPTNLRHAPERTNQRYAGTGTPKERLAQANAHIQQAPDQAAPYHQRGLAELALGQTEAARASLQLAVDHDLGGRRVSSGLVQVTRELCASDPGIVECVDLDAAFRAADPQGIPGDEALFVDYCHPAFGQGADLVAQGFADALQAWITAG